MDTKYPDQELVDLQEKLLKAREAVSEAQERRDGQIAHLLAQGHSVRSLAHTTGITRQSIMRIRELRFPDHKREESNPLFDAGRGSSLD